MARKRINTRSHTKKKPHMINSQFLQNWEGKIKVNRGEQNTCMNVSGICAEGIFVSFPWWLKNVKRRSTIAFFFKWASFWNLISKKETIIFFRRKLSQLHKKTHNFASDIYIFAKARGNQNKQWTHLGTFKGLKFGEQNERETQYGVEGKNNLIIDPQTKKLRRSIWSYACFGARSFVIIDYQKPR